MAAVTGYLGAEPLPLGREVAPFIEFDAEDQIRIAADVMKDTPPPPYLDLGLAIIPSRSWYEWYWFRGKDPEKMRRRLPKALREQVIRRDGLVCQLCGGVVERADVHIDHIHPVALGGSDFPGNLQVTHSVCNMRKGAKVLGVGAPG